MNVDLSTTYLGLRLRNPLVVSACPLTGQLDVLRAMEEYGAAAAVLPSLFEEQFDEGQRIEALGELSYQGQLREYNRGPESYLQYLAAAKKAVAIPVIASLNATGPGKLVEHARRIEETGADALEINLYLLPTDPDLTGQEIEARCVELVASVHDQVSIPIAVKLLPYFTSLPNVARRLVDAGASGLVLFNRMVQPDIDLDLLQVQRNLHLSTPDELRLSLRWIALLHGRTSASLAATSGVHFADDAIRLLLAGADAVMVASTLYRHGVDSLRTLVEGISYWLEAREYQSVSHIHGKLSQMRCPDPAIFERPNYTSTISSFLTDSTT